MTLANAFNAFELHQGSEVLKNNLSVYPNPFKDILMVKYSIKEYSKVQIVVYDQLGKTVDIIYDGTKESGIYELNWLPEQLVNGVYYINLKTNTESIVTKAILIK